MVLIRLRRCAGWSAPLLLAYSINRFSHDVVHMAVNMYKMSQSGKNEPAHDKTNKMTCAQRRLRSEYSLGAKWQANDPVFLHADSEDSDKTGRMPRLIWIFAGRICHFVGFVMQWLTRTAPRLWSTCLYREERKKKKTGLHMPFCSAGSTRLKFIRTPIPMSHL